MENLKRFAIYHCPTPGPFADLMARWLGWDVDRGQPRPHPQIDGLPLPVEMLTSTPRKYGFHGTLKPPFRLAEGSSPMALQADLARLATRLTPVTLPGLELRRISRFLALVPMGDQRALSDLAAQVVQSLDSHRAPALPAELTRRRKAGLSPAQDAHLLHWGYPYVMEEFRFHMTLTGALDPEQVELTGRALDPILRPLLPQPLVLDALCLCGEDAQGRFHLLHRYALTG